jgi:hypothetical protein
MTLMAVGGWVVEKMMHLWYMVDMELFKASHHGDLEKVKAIYQNEAISPETMAKAATIACKFGQLEVLQYFVAIMNGKILQCYIDNAAKFKQDEVSAWLKKALEEQRKEQQQRQSEKALQKASKQWDDDPENAVTPIRPPSFIHKKVKKFKQR